jgi:hypothetical protein
VRGNKYCSIRKASGNGCPCTTESNREAHAPASCGIVLRERPVASGQAPKTTLHRHDGDAELGRRPHIAGTAPRTQHSTTVTVTACAAAFSSPFWFRRVEQRWVHIQRAESPTCAPPVFALARIESNWAGGAPAPPIFPPPGPSLALRPDWPRKHATMDMADAKKALQDAGIEQKADECVKVVVRCRPFNSKERKEGRKKIVDVDIKNGIIRVADPSAGPKAPPNTYTFDQTYDETTVQINLCVCGGLSRASVGREVGLCC